MNTEEKSNICDRLSCFNVPHSTPALTIFQSFSASHRNTLHQGRIDYLILGSMIALEFSLGESVIDSEHYREGIDSQIRLPEIPSDLSCAYLKGPREGPRLVSDIRISVSAEDRHGLGTAKAALSKAFPAIRNKKDLEIKFYASQQRRDQEPTDFVYDL
ncbi:uncharacterized protein TNCV_3421871 [Trichonephila clavipes]|nr:uncharacterized protein TNCV_3421871 [Trichonephila clavipes]